MSTILHSPVLSSRFDSATEYALVLHREQRRKGSNVPYAAHLLAVCSIVLDHGGDEDEAIAALLHDAAEDQGGWETLKAIEFRYGARVAAIVNGCTDSYGEPKPAWRPRKEAFVARLAASSRSVKLVAASDKLHNLRTTVADLRRAGSETLVKFNASPRDQLWYYGACIDALGQGIPPELRATLAWTRAEFEMLLVLPPGAAPHQAALDLR
jgi:(p)ppGpp synthase/HD superfamily hydrolase